MTAWRAALLGFDEEGQPWRIDDGLLLVEQGRIIDLGPFAEATARHPGVAIVDRRGLTLAPGFIDAHVHYLQIDMIGAPAPGLLPWLQRHTFPLEARFDDPALAARTADFFLDELLRNGVTTALAWGSVHPQSAEALLAQSRARRMRMIVGKCLMDTDVPESVRDDARGGLEDTAALIARWHGVDRLGCAITPRFAPSCSPAQIAGAGELARAHPTVWVQSHAAENPDEFALVRRLHPRARSYLDVYDAAGLLRPRSVYAHCIHIDDHDRRRLADSGAAVAVCPSSNLFLGSGLFDFDAAGQAGMRWALASDVGAGTSLCPLRTMLAAFEVARLRGATPTAAQLWWHHTAGAARAVGLEGLVGNLEVGLEADFIVLDPQATPLLARRTAMADSLEEWLFAMMALGDDRAVREVVVLGEGAVGSR
ncbi:guanine deaminase [Quisquiliibacterium transsilvanicum]|uniref:Guanine deaminase n=1 Tax=Quisquiliibacterium transsilvanicum TaxID=1549638 RepID=A0A7W8HET0_9BURK|nr:guanine deaminase [Quisquiliibacterium transsilvanicum]MBB5270186.1 guanine deaminase [Quisquiliibacterium transsilvanicum]